MEGEGAEYIPFVKWELPVRNGYLMSVISDQGVK